MKNKKPPRVLTDVGLSVFVNTIKLRRLPLPVVEVDIADLMWHFDMPVWEKDGTDDWNLTPWEVIKKQKGAKGHGKRVGEVDTKFPIIITKYRSRYVVLDGAHRLVKVYMSGKKKIKAKVVPRSHLLLRKL